MTAVRPILFSAPMIRALLEGRKTQTRRMIKPQPEPFMTSEGMCEVAAEWNDNDPMPRVRLGRVITVQRLPYGKPGHLLWVRETWADASPHGIRYAATDDIHELRKKRSPIFMPRAASRLTLEITDVRIQRLQDISEADVDAEGIDYASRPFGDWSLIPGIWKIDWKPGDIPPPRIKYAHLWNTINTAKGARWADNPWIVALSFAVHKQNVDAVLAQRQEAA